MTKNYHESKGSWYVAPMSRLEWLETMLKSIAIVIAFVTFIQVFATERLETPTGAAHIQSRILMWMAIALTIAILDRLQQRELLSIGFVIANDLAHWAMYLAFLSGLSTMVPVIVYCAFMMVGDIVKLAFFATSGYTVRGAPRPLLLAGVGAFVLAYGAILVLAL
jgi:hypothetical protein